MRGLRQTLNRVLMGAVLALGLTQPAHAQKLDPDDALLFDVRLGQYRLGEGVRGYRTPGGSCVDLADTIIALDLPIRLDKKLRRATGWAFAESRTILINREADTVQIMNRTSVLGPGAVYDAPEGWCVDTKQLSGWLGVELDADEANALLVIKSSTKLPVELQMERKARAAKVRNVAAFDLAQLPQAQARFGAPRMPAIDAVVSLGGIRQGSTRSQRSEFSRSYEIYAAGEVGPIAYNARLSSNRKGAPDSLRVQAYRTDPNGQLLGPLKATHVAAGDVSGYSTPLVSQSAIGRGAVITNRPVERRDSFDRTDFRGELPAGWDAELYRNGQLLAFAMECNDGRYEFLDVPLLYGQNRFEVVLYGPQGQVRRELKTVPVGLESIPPRKTYYWAGFLDEGRDLVGGFGGDRFGRTGLRGTVGLERGLNAKTSVAALGHSLVLQEGRRRSYAEIALRRAVGPTLVELSASQAVEGGTAVRAQMLGEFGKTYLSAESIMAQGRFRSDRVLETVTGLHTVSLDHSLDLGRSQIPLHVDARYTTRATGNDSLDAGARVSTAVGRMSLTGEIGWRRDTRRFGPDPDDAIDAGLLANARVGRVRLRGEARYRLSPESRFESMSLIGEWSGGRDDRSPNDWRAEIGYDRALRRGRAGIGYIRKFDKVALITSLEGGTDGSVAAGLNLAFSFGPDPRGSGGMRVTSKRLATQGQAVVLVYRDLNGDKIRQPDEPLEKDVQLAAGRIPIDALTDAGGQVIVDSLEPFRPVLIGIDASSLPDPLVQPASPGVVVTPRPGIAVAIELPLSSAGEIDGTLARQGGGTIEGVDLELIDGEGRVQATARSEYDGFFLFEGVPYGRYAIRVGKLSAEAARLAVPLTGGVVVSGDAPSVHLGTVAGRPSEMQAKAQAP